MPITATLRYGLGAVLLLVACESATLPADLNGTYALASVNGKSLPASITASDGCIATYSYGRVVINDPSFSMNWYEERRCPNVEAGGDVCNSDGVCAPGSAADDVGGLLDAAGGGVQERG